MTVILTSEASVIIPEVARRLGGEIFKRRFVCISTAAVPFPERAWVAREQECLRAQGASITELELSTMQPGAVREAIENSEGIYVHGGNTFFLLQEMQRVGIPELIHDYLKSGRIYIGSSAGSIVAGPHMRVIATTIDPATAPRVDLDTTLKLVNVVPFVHFNNAQYWPAFRVAFEKAIEQGANVLTLRDDQFVVVEDSGMRVMTAG